MRPLTRETATPDLIGQRLYCARTRAFWPVVTVTSVDLHPVGAPAMVFLGYQVEAMPEGQCLMELADHPNTRILVDASGSPWQILETGEEPPG